MIDMPAMKDARLESFRRDWRGEVRREIKASWPISGQTQGEDGHYLVFEAWHDKDRKSFTASVDTYELADHGTTVRRIFDYGQSSVRLRSEPVARYSAKALSIFFDAHFISTELRDAMRVVLDANEERVTAAA